MSLRSAFTPLVSRAQRGAQAAAVARRTLVASTARASESLFVHRDTDYNNPKIPFTFNADTLKAAHNIISRYPPQYKKAAVMPVLDLAQRQNGGWVSISSMNAVAELLEMPRMRVYEVATFYTMYNREPVAPNFVQLCTTTPCQLGGCGSTKILETIEKHLGVHPGQTTKDGKFTFIEVECLGACSNAPMMQIGDDFYEDLTPETTVKILDALAKGEKPKAGPQSSRRTSETSQAAARVRVQYASLPFAVREDDFLQIRPVEDVHARQGMTGGGEALEGVRERARQGYIFKLGADDPSVPLGQIQVPNSTAQAFRMQNRLDVQVAQLHQPDQAYADFIELQFSQYVGRADMWRLGMLLEKSSVHVGEKVSLAGGAVRATVTGIHRGRHRYSSAIVTAKTKTIYRSKSAQTYLFIQLCQETWEFDEDGERYYEKVLHGFLPELFSRWKATGASHLVTIILFARVYYDDDEVGYMERHDLTLGLGKDYRGRWCKDFFRVIVDFERKADWNAALREIKLRMERSEREILLDFHLGHLGAEQHDQKRILGTWSFAYEGNVLEAINLALNPFDEHYIDRDLSRTGLSMTVITPGTGHFAVDKNLLRLTTERMVDHGIGLDLVCLTKMPLHSVPLFSYLSERPTQTEKAKPATPDPLYFDAPVHLDRELTDCYSLAFWVYCSFYSVTHDKPFRNDRFIPRCKMYEIQMLGILDHNLTTVIVPLLDEAASDDRIAFDSGLFGSGPAPKPVAGTSPNSLPSMSTSYQSARLLATRETDDASSLKQLQDRLVALNPDVAKTRDTPDTPTPDTLDVPTPDAAPAPRLPNGPHSPSVRSGVSSEAVDSIDSGASTPVSTPARRLKNQPSKGSFASRFGASWLFGALGRSQPSHPAAAATTVSRQDVATSATTAPRPTAPAPMSLPMPTRSDHPTQPVPILAPPRVPQDDMARSLPKSMPRSLVASFKPGRSLDDSYRIKLNAAYGRTARHTTVNPCNAATSADETGGHNRRWQHVRATASNNGQHVVKWRSLCAPACLPLTTDFMPTPQDISTFYEANSYDIACFSDQISFLVKQDLAQENLPLAVMREMASQRLSPAVAPGTETKVLLPGDSISAGLRVGGASEVLKDARGAIYLSWSNHIHRLTFDPAKQSVTVQRFVRKVRHSTEPHAYKCLVWPYQTTGYREATADFKYPNVDARLNFNYLDRLIAGEEDQLTSSLRYWRTRYLLIPSGLDPTVGAMPSGDQFNLSETLITGAQRILELLGRLQWPKRPAGTASPLKLLATTYDPAACVLDEGLMTELERVTGGKERTETGLRMKGMTLQAVADLMNKDYNGLIIRDRRWLQKVHKNSFTGEQYCSWLRATFVDITTVEQAIDWGQSLLDKGLIEHVNDKHLFHDNQSFYRLRGQYADARTTAPPQPRRKRKVTMSQSIVIDLDPASKSDRAEVAVLHADIIHNARNAFHFELNWLGVTAGLLEELRGKCSTVAERYGLRFVEAPVEQIKDISLKCAYRTPIHIKLARAPPPVADTHDGPHPYEYAILCQRFGFVLDLEASSRYPDTVQVEYSYRGKQTFAHSQFIHQSGLALVQCLGEHGYLWADNRPFLSAPSRGRGEVYPGISPKATKQEQATELRAQFTAFCADASALAEFYQQVQSNVMNLYA
ncbi:vacuolar membrane-associated protein iml1 [Cryptotrichosporon argae]